MKVRASNDSDVTIQTAEYDGIGRRMKKVVTNSGDLDGTVVYFYDGWKICETRDGSNNVYQQFIHGTRYIDELVMVRVADKGDLYVHQDANWNVIGLTDMGGSTVERYVLSPYGQLTVNQETGYGDYDGDGDVDATDRAAAEGGGACRGSGPSGACRILDLDFDDDVDDADLTLFDALPSGLAQHPGRIATAVNQPFGHQGLLHDAEIGSYQNRRRQYDPPTRRFLQTDPLAFQPHGFWTVRHYGDGMNLYQYVRGNPGAYRDSLGACMQGNTYKLIVGKKCCGGYKYRYECKYCPCDYWVFYDKGPWTACCDEPGDAEDCEKPVPPMGGGFCCAFFEGPTENNCKECCWETVDGLPPAKQREEARACELQQVCNQYP